MMIESSNENHCQYEWNEEKDYFEDRDQRINEEYFLIWNYLSNSLKDRRDF